MCRRLVHVLLFVLAARGSRAARLSGEASDLVVRDAVAAGEGWAAAGFLREPNWAPPRFGFILLAGSDDASIWARRSMARNRVEMYH